VIFDALVMGHVRNEALRTLVTLLAVALGIGVAVAIALANATALRSLRSDATLLRVPTDLQIVGEGNGLDERIISRVRYLPGVAQARPIVEGDAFLVNRATRNSSTRARTATGGETVHVIGVDALQPLPGVGDVAGVGNVAEREPGAYAPRGVPLDPGAMIAGGAVVSTRVAHHYGLRSGTTFTVLVGTRLVSLRVAEVLPPTVSGVDSSVMFVDVATAQTMFDAAGRLDRIDIVVGGSRTAERKRLADELPRSAHIESAAANTSQLGRLLANLEFDLTVLAGLAVVLAATLVYGAVGTSVAARRADIGTLRGLGATRVQIFGVFLGEGALFGALGSLVGIVFGTFCARTIVAALLPRTTVGASVDVASDVPMLLGALGLGIVIATLSALLPARAAMRIPPAQAMGARGFESGRRGPRAWPLLGAPFPPWLLLAAGNVTAAPKRMMVALAALIVALVATIGFATANASFAAALHVWAEQTLTGDLIVRPQTRSLFDARTIRHARSVPGIARIESSRSLRVAFRDTIVTLHGDDSQGGRPGDAVVSASLAARFGLRVGDRIDAGGAAGHVMLRVAATRDDYADPGGALFVGRDLLVHRYHEPQADTLAIFLKPRVDAAAVRTRLIMALAPMRLEVRTTRELRSQALGLFERTFAIANALAAISLVIAVFGILTTLAALVLERRREMGQLRYAGATGGTIRAMILSEAALLGALACVLGLLLGVGLGALELRFVDRRLFGSAIALHIPLGSIGIALAATLLAALIAGLYPSRLAAHIATDAARTAT